MLGNPRQRAVRTGASIWPTVICCVTAFALGGAAMHFLRPVLTIAKPDSVERSPITVISGLGRIQPKSGIIAVYAAPGDRVAAVLKQRGDFVRKGEKLLVLQSEQLHEQEISLLQHQLAEARSQLAALDDFETAKLREIDAELANLMSGKEPDLKAQDAKIAALRKAVSVANDRMQRLKQLRNEGLKSISEQQVEDAEVSFRRYEAELTASIAIRQKSERAYEEGLKVAQAKRIAAEKEFAQNKKRIPIDSLGKQLQLLEIKHRLSQITAPFDGEVLQVNCHAGDATGTQPLLSFAARDRLIVIAEVHESNVQDLRTWLQNEDVTVRISGRGVLRDEKAGDLRISTLLPKSADKAIAGMIARNSIFSLNPRADQDRRVIEVEIDLTNDQGRVFRDFIGLQVEVAFEKSR